MLFYYREINFKKRLSIAFLFYLYTLQPLEGSAGSHEHSGEGALRIGCDKQNSNHLLARLPAADFSWIQTFLKTVTLEPGRILQEYGENIAHVYFPHCGVVSLLTVMKDGESIEAAGIGREGAVGSMCGLGPLRSTMQAVVQVGGTASRVSALQFQKIISQSDALRDLVIRHHEMLLAQVQQIAACNALHAVEARMIRWLLQTRDRVEGNVIPITQEFISTMLGVRRTTVSLVAQTLQSTGLIRCRRGLIEIIDGRALEQVSCECYKAIHCQINQMFPKQIFPHQVFSEQALPNSKH